MIIPDCDQEGSLALAGETGRWENKAIFLPFEKALPESPSVQPSDRPTFVPFFTSLPPFSEREEMKEKDY